MLLHLLSVSPALKSMEQRWTSKGKKASLKLQRRLVWNSVQVQCSGGRGVELQTSFVAERVFLPTVQSGRALAPAHNSSAPDHRQPPARIQRYLAGSYSSPQTTTYVGKLHDIFCCRCRQILYSCSERWQPE